MKIEDRKLILGVIAFMGIFAIAIISMIKYDFQLEHVLLVVISALINIIKGLELLKKKKANGNP